MYHINYGFIIKGLELTAKRHVYYRLFDSERLLDLENVRNEAITLTKLKELVTVNIFSKLQRINTEAELLQEIRKLPILKGFSVVFKNYFGLYNV
jgi:hypothetical protein